jgi:hypothetical protein
MKRILLLSAAFLFAGILYGQAPDKIYFEYDIAGNQIVRYVCSSCKFSDNIKEIVNLTEEDLIKSFPDDVISYYPNPVKDDLYIKWQIIDNNYVKEIMLYDFNSRLIYTKNDLSDKDNITLNFSPYSKGIYLAILVYNNGDQKSIKISKE